MQFRRGANPNLSWCNGADIFVGKLLQNSGFAGIVEAKNKQPQLTVRRGLEFSQIVEKALHSVDNAVDVRSVVSGWPRGGSVAWTTQQDKAVRVAC